MDAELPGGSALVALMGSHNLLQVDPLELTARHLQGDAAAHHFGYEIPQLVTHFSLSNDPFGTPKVTLH